MKQKGSFAEEVVTRSRKFGSSDPQQRTLLLDISKKLSAEEVVPALLSIFADSKNPDADEHAKDLAGFLLWHGPHSCPLPPREVILMLLDGWDLSIEEVPWYLTREFGRDAVLGCIAELSQQVSSPWHHRVLDTLAFWVRNYERFH